MADASTWIRRLGRLGSMDRREMFDRARQYLMARADAGRYRGGRGFGEKAQPDADLTGRFFFGAGDVPSLCTLLRERLPAESDRIVAQAERICRHRFDLLGYENLDYGAEIDWHLDVVHGKRAPREPWFKVKYLDFEEVGDSKIIWELNRHPHFVTLAKAYRLTGNEKFAREIFTQWTQWRGQNPYPVGINWASSLEVAYRSLAWIWTFFLLQECPVFDARLRKDFLDTLRLSGRHIETYLSTYFSPNTHLLGEALALFSLGTLFPDFEAATRWRRSGWEILERGAARQVRADGFYFEQSTYYHVYAADIFLHARVLAGINGVEISSGFDETLERMLNALCLLGRAGAAPSIGDDDGGRLFDPRRNRAEHMLDPLATGAVLYRRRDFKAVAHGLREETIWLLGATGLAEFDSLPTQKPREGSTAVVESGFYLMSDEEAAQQLVIDAGPFGAGSGGHAHADALSVCLVRNGQNLLIDPGTFEYVGPSGGRAHFRGTGAHNTMRVDGREQADGSGPFSWKNPPRVAVEEWIVGRNFDLFQGSHDGYSRLPSPVTHCRWVFHKKGEFWLVRDLAEGKGQHQLDLSWHVGAKLRRDSSRPLRFSGEGENLALVSAEGHGWSQTETEDSWSPAYGRRESANVIHFGIEAELPADFASVLLAGDSLPEDLGRLVRIKESSTGAVCGYRYSNRQQENVFFFCHPPGAWTLGAWASDADFLFWSLDREKERYMLVLCSGTYADAEGRRVLNCGQRVGYAEVVSVAKKVEIFSSDPERVVLERPLERVWAESKIAGCNDPEGTGA